MAYDLLIRNGRIVDGSGMPAFKGDLAVKDGIIVEIGKINGAAARTIDDLWDGIRDALTLFTPHECANYFTAAGYEPE